MKKALAFLFAIGLVLALCSCADNLSENHNKSKELDKSDLIDCIWTFKADMLDFVESRYTDSISKEVGDNGYVLQIFEKVDLDITMGFEFKEDGTFVTLGRTNEFVEKTKALYRYIYSKEGYTALLMAKNGYTEEEAQTAMSEFFPDEYFDALQKQVNEMTDEQIKEEVLEKYEPSQHDGWFIISKESYSIVENQIITDSQNQSYRYENGQLVFIKAFSDAEDFEAKCVKQEVQ